MDSSGGHNQEMSSDSLGNMLGQKLSGQAQQSGDRKTRPQPEQALKCPRCDSTNTKFCYYNNYSLTQPRYFCKACRRYWTKGGTLRNVPVGGGCRKNRRSSATSSSSSSPAQPKRIDHHIINPLLHHQNYVNSLQISGPTFGFQSGNLPGLGGYDQNDLSLAFSRLQQQNNNSLSLGGNDGTILGGANNNSAGFLDTLRSGFIDPHGQSGSSFYDQSMYDDHQVMTSTASVSVTTVKQETCNNKMLWGYNASDHHHLHQNGIGNLADFDGSAAAAANGGARESWNGFASSWHGLLNTTPLM